MEVICSEFSAALRILFPSIKNAPAMGSRMIKKEVNIKRIADNVEFHPLSSNFSMGLFKRTNKVMVPRMPEK